jgi:hypothetical protein
MHPKSTFLHINTTHLKSYAVQYNSVTNSYINAYSDIKCMYLFHLLSKYVMTYFHIFSNQYLSVWIKIVIYASVYYVLVS